MRAEPSSRTEYHVCVSDRNPLPVSHAHCHSVSTRLVLSWFELRPTHLGVLVRQLAIALVVCRDRPEVATGRGVRRIGLLRFFAAAARQPVAKVLAPESGLGHDTADRRVLRGAGDRREDVARLYHEPTRDTHLNQDIVGCCPMGRSDTEPQETSVQAETATMLPGEMRHPGMPAPAARLVLVADVPARTHGPMHRGCIETSTGRVQCIDHYEGMWAQRSGGHASSSTTRYLGSLGGLPLTGPPATLPPRSGVGDRSRPCPWTGGVRDPSRADRYRLATSSCE